MEKLNEHYYKSIGLEIESQFNRVSSLVHNARLASGEWKEQIFRNFLIRYIPKKFGVGRGYIKNPYDNKSSNQIDILIYDKEKYAPYFQDRDFIIIPPEAAIAVIEVKSGTKKNITVGDKVIPYGDLDAAFKNIQCAKEVTDTNFPGNFQFPISFIIFLDSIWTDFNEFGHCLADWHEAIPENKYPQAIIIWNKYLGWTMHQEPTGIKIGAIKEDDDISFPFFFGLLTNYLMIYQGIKPAGGKQWSDFMKANFFDFEHPNRDIWHADNIKIGAGPIKDSNKSTP